MKKLCTIVVPNGAQSIITNVDFARVYASGVVQLNYKGGASESANITVHELAAGREDFFKLVNAVQGCRPDTLRFPE